MKLRGRIFGTDKNTMEIENGKIVKIGDISKPIDVDFGDNLILPGFIDIHTHGAMGKDTMDGTDAAMDTMKRHMADHGVTSFCPTTVTMPQKALLTSIRAAKKNRLGMGAEILGVHLEGPFYAAAYKGAQNASYLRAPNIEDIKPLIEEDFVRIVSLAPELSGADKVIRFLKEEGVVAAAGHSAADYDAAMEGIMCGISHVTHLYNAMSPFGHRTPNMVGAALTSDKVTVEIICDGQHIHPAAALLAIRAKGAENVVFISDSMCAAGMTDGIYALGGQTVYVKDGKATIENGALAGGISNVFDCFKNAVSWGVPMEDAVRMATENPARVVGAVHKGKLRLGMDADFIVVNERLDLVSVYIRGMQWK